MWKIISLLTIQSLFFAAAQVFLKIAMTGLGKVGFTWAFLRNISTNLPLITSGICMIIGTALWMYIIKNFSFSIVYPITSISYVFGMLAAIYIFHETVPFTRWIGLFLIMGGIVLIAK